MGQQPPDSSDPQRTADEQSKLAAHMMLPGQPDQADDLAAILKGPSAPVRLPTEQEMEVQLVGLQTLDRLFEAQADADIHKTIELLAIGALVGFITNVATTVDFVWTAAAYAFVAASSAIVVSFGALVYRSHSRLTRLRGQLRSSGDA